jgi:hypothetical protein
LGGLEAADMIPDCYNFQLTNVAKRKPDKSPGKCKKKVKLSLCFLTKHHAMKAYWWSGGIPPLIL